MVLCYLYLGPLKRSRWRTLGYQLTDLRIVDLHGHRPSLPRMTFRCVLLTLGAGFWLFDLLWILGNSDRRKFSDQFAGTYVVRARARPVGFGPIVATYYYFVTNCFVFGEVARAPIDRRPLPA
jgi:uncharacterized RDD family membrane protein YckC